MFHFKWTHEQITTNKRANELREWLQALPISVAAFDTETTGLNIGFDKPFLFQFGFILQDQGLGYTFLVDIERQPLLSRAVIQMWHTIAERFERYLAHNVKFDLHMLANMGLPYPWKNLSDTMFYIRYAHDAVQESNGGPPLKLKVYTSRYIDATARDHDKLLQAERSQIAKDLNLRLKIALKELKPPAEWKAKAYTLGVLQDHFDDVVFDLSELPQDAQDAYENWLNTVVPEGIRWQVTSLVYPEQVPYTMLNRRNLYHYAHMDIVDVLEVWWKTAPVLHARHQEYALFLEDTCIYPFWEMERVGFHVDQGYLAHAHIELRKYIIDRRARLYELIGQKIGSGQHDLIKKLLRDRFSVTATSTNADELELLVSDLEAHSPDTPAIEFIEVLLELRTLEKWYAVYLMRFINNLKKADRLYTQVNQVGTISGRVSSDFQQFPKGGIVTVDGRELFNPRRAILPTGGEYDSIVFLDYSQIELRVQAQYTILLETPDLNLCRAYMPFKCHSESGISFDYTNPQHLATWNGTWLRDEDDSVWTPTDLHGATTTTITGLHPGDPGFKEERSKKGKRVNFASQYGAKKNRFRRMFPHASEEELDRITDSYYLTFPGTKAYHEYCNRAARECACVPNLYGVYYYGTNGHKLINLLIQGSSAFFLKDKICLLYAYSKEQGVKSRFQMNIHDELSWERHVSEVDVFFAFKEIMEAWEGMNIPIIAEMEVTKTNWAEKKGVQTRDELHAYLGD